MLLKDTIETTKRQAIEWVKIFAEHLSDRGFIYRIWKEHLQLNDKNTNNPIKKSTRVEHFTKR